MENVIDSKYFQNPNKTIYQALLDASELFGDNYALGFYGRRITYKELIDNIDRVAKALISAGVKRGDFVTFMLPNCPQAVFVYYAINRIGAVGNIIHTLSSEDSIAFCINKAKSRFIVTMDSFCEKVKHASVFFDNDVKIIYTKIIDEMPYKLKITLSKENNIFSHSDIFDGCLYLNDLIAESDHIKLPKVEYVPDTVATILYSGGTTGTSKGICLSDRNINYMIRLQPFIVGKPIVVGKKFLSIMPFFHGFGLGFGLHAYICSGFQCVLIPKFDFDECIKVLIEEKINYINAVPSIYEAFLRSDMFDNVDLSFFEGAICGGDSASIDLHKRFNTFLKNHNCNSFLREGYGLTENVCTCIANPLNDTRAGSIGIPLYENKVRIVNPGTFDDMPYGEKGELILSGPSVMLEYLDEPEETKKVLKKDSDGKTWLYTGDICYMKDGYVYYVQRLKRMIVTNGYNVYPVQVEQVIKSCDCVNSCCVIGINNKLLGQIVAAYVILNDGYESKKSRIEIIKACKAHLTAFEVPTKIVFVDKFPLTKVGKIDFKTLEKIENEKAGL